MSGPHGRRPGALMRRVLRVPVFLYRWRLGSLLGHRFLLLTHVGRRSGRTHHTVLEVVRFDGDRCEAVVVSGFGRTSDWLRNLEAGSRACVEIARKRFAATFRELNNDDAVVVIADYERRNRLAAPIVRVVLSRLAGWRYRGTSDDRRRLVAELPLIAFSPSAVPR
jgi:deazaflavin-dependent oxidoreductase (nitroreductase family)